jgi:alkylation response protein AidB-like acyl-CoA dehydrogenase
MIRVNLFLVSPTFGGSMKYPDLDELSEENRILKEEVHRFAAEIIRPASIKLDRMSPEERIKRDSPYFGVMKKMKKLSYHKLHVPSEFGGPDLSALERYIIMEELGWGSLGLATAIGVDQIPFVNALLFGPDELVEDLVKPWLEDEECRYHGCWGVTEPEHGSDYLLCFRDEEANKFGKGNVIAQEEEDGWVLKGQKSAWVSSAPVATHCGLHAQVKDGKAIYDGIFCIVPLDAGGVRKGKVADMMGMRDGPQGELFFDNVWIPEHYVVVAPTPFYGIFFDQLLCLTSCGMGAFAVGLARAAFEEALTYARQREQGGKPLVKHKNIKLKLYEMFEKIETARYFVRKTMEHVHRKILEEKTFDAFPRHSRAAQIYAKKIAFEVANEALQIFGAYGLSSDFIIEKLFRDARALLIEDGTIEVLSFDAADDVISNYEKDYYDVEDISGRYG